MPRNFQWAHATTRTTVKVKTVQKQQIFGVSAFMKARLKHKLNLLLNKPGCLLLLSACMIFLVFVVLRVQPSVPRSPKTALAEYSQSDSGQNNPVSLKSALSAAASNSLRLNKALEIASAFWVILCLVNEAATRDHLPLFVSSLKKHGRELHRRLVVVALDKAAQTNCKMIHDPGLCILDTGSGEEQFSNSSLLGTAMKLHSEEYFFVGWHRVELVREALSFGYSVLTFDIDVVFFRNPVSFFLPLHADITVADDCVGKPYNPKLRTGHGPNLGVLQYRNSPEALLFVDSWLARKQPGVWDQIAFKEQVEKSLVERPGFRVQVLDLNRFPNFCCDYCAGAKEVWLKDRQLPRVCPRNVTDRWVTFHASCAGPFNTWKTPWWSKWKGDELKILLKYVSGEVDDI